MDDATASWRRDFVAVMNIASDPEGLVQARQRARAARPLQRRAVLLGCRSAEEARGSRRRSGATSRSRRSSARISRRRSAWWRWCSRARRRRRRRMRAAQLAKCDLTTEMVKEFTELQGVVGGLYARAQGEPEEVWRRRSTITTSRSAWRTRFLRHATGQVVALADKLDTLRGCFAIGMIPTGSRDPFALRRAAQGVVKILVEGKLRLPAARSARRRRAAARVLARTACATTSAMSAASTTTKSTRCWRPGGTIWSMSSSAWQRFAAVRPTENFEPLAASFKRIQNILRAGAISRRAARSIPRCSKPVRKRICIASSCACASVSRRGAGLSARARSDRFAAAQGGSVLRQSAGERSGRACPAEPAGAAEQPADGIFDDRRFFGNRYTQ